MPSLSSELASLTRDGVNAVRGIFSPLISQNTRDFNDVLKRSEAEKLRLYCLASSNVPTTFYPKVDSVVDIVVNSAIRTIMNNMIDSDPVAARDFFQRNFTNGKGIVDTFINGAQGINDALGEHGAAVIDFKVQFNEGQETITLNVPLTEAKNKNKPETPEQLAARMNAVGEQLLKSGKLPPELAAIEAKMNADLKAAAQKSSGRKPISGRDTRTGETVTSQNGDVPGFVSKRTAAIAKSSIKSAKGASWDREREAEEKLLAKSNLKYTTEVSSTVLQAANEKTGYSQITRTQYNIQYAAEFGSGTLTMVVTTEVSSMEVDSTKLLEAMASAKNRNIFASYLAARAGTIPWFKGFLLNLGEVRKQVNRDLSKNIGERALGSLLSRTGFTRPKVIGDITEFKNYSVVITADDADRLIRDYGINLTKTSDLVKVFANMNILMLFVIDPLKERATMYQSNRPTEMLVTSIKSENELIRFSKMINSFNAG